MAGFLDWLIGAGLVIALLCGTASVAIGLMVGLAAILARLTSGPASVPERRLVKYVVGLPFSVTALGVVLAIGGCALDDAHQAWTRERDLELLGSRAQPLLAAIEAFRTEHGCVPRRLEDLVPRQLSEVPSTGLERWDSFMYYEEDATDFELYVWVPKTWFDMDDDSRFEYAPDPSGDAALGATLRCGDWVYVPD
jgi:hypothetical protein